MNCFRERNGAGSCGYDNAWCDVNWDGAFDKGGSLEHEPLLRKYGVCSPKDFAPEYDSGAGVR